MDAHNSNGTHIRKDIMHTLRVVYKCPQVVKHYPTVGNYLKVVKPFNQPKHT